MAGEVGAAENIKVFCFFSSEKKTFLFHLSVRAVAVCKSCCILPRDTPLQIAIQARAGAQKRLLRNDFTGTTRLAPGLHGKAKIGRSAHVF
jgi:hypothetical protein